VYVLVVDLNLYVKDGEALKLLKVPHTVVKDLLRDRLGEKDLARIHRLAQSVDEPSIFKAGSVVVNFSNKTAQCFDAKLNVANLEPTWDILVEKTTLNNY
jgi:hypothetical protein